MKQARVPQTRMRVLGAAGAVLVAAAFGFAWSRSRSQPAPVHLDTIAKPALPPPSPTPIQHVRLAVLPSDVSVEVDGVRAEVVEGSIEITGSLGSAHRVRLFNANSEKQVDVVVTDQGALPSKVELPPPPPSEPSAVKPGVARVNPPRPSLPTVRSNTAPKASTSVQALPPKRDDDDIKRTVE